MHAPRHHTALRALLGVVLGIGLPLSVQAADAMTDALQAVNAHYRSALYQTNMGSPAQALDAVLAAQTAWDAFVRGPASHPNPPYDRDVALPRTIQAVNGVFEQAVAQGRAGQAKEAHTTLEAVREHWADLRARNNVIVFSDHMNAYHAQMEHVMVEGEGFLSETNGWAKFNAQAGVLAYLAEGLKGHAPQSLQSDADFQKLLTAVEHSVHAVVDAGQRADTAAVRKAIAALKGPYSKLFARFG